MILNRIYKIKNVSVEFYQTLVLLICYHFAIIIIQIQNETHD